MTLTIERTAEDTQVEAVIDLENGTWTCTVHEVTMDIASGLECPECVSTPALRQCTHMVHAPPDARELVS